MHHQDLHHWQHPHDFGQAERRPGETRTLVVVALTSVTMVVEIGAGIAFGSMALLADGMHMASHATALGISAVAYAYARRHARNPHYTFGTGKVNALAGFAGAVLLATFAALMAWESATRLASPVPIAFDQAILVAVLGLVVNGVSMVILDHREPAAPDGLADTHPDGHDHNLKSAYLHVLADALTSALAIAALLCAKYAGLYWMDPVVGLLGAALVGRWSIGLLRTTSDVLLDRQDPYGVAERIRSSIEADEDSRVADLHVWSIGPGICSAVVTVVARDPAPPEAYKACLPNGLGLAHVAIEVRDCRAEGAT